MEMKNVKTLYQRAFWSLTVGVAMFFVFLLLLAHQFTGFDWWFVAVGVAFFVFVAAPLTAWLTIERFAVDDAINSVNYYRVWELERITRFGKQMMLWGNPIGWLIMIIGWCALKAVMRWPTLGLYIAILFP